MTENIVVVDEEDNFIANKPRDLVDKEKLRYRVSVLWIKNSKGEILLAKRAYTKSHYPGRWGPAVAGTVDEGESYEKNIIKEAEEELGLTNIKIKEGPKVKISGKYNHFTQWFIGHLNKPADYFKIQEEEVAEVKWFSKEEFKTIAKEHPEMLVKSLQEIPNELL